METIKKGQTLYYKPDSFDRNQEIRPVKVQKVGRKYFYIEGFNWSKFEKATMKEINEANSKGKCYVSLAEIELEKTIKTKLSEISNFFSSPATKNLSLEQIDKIIKIINE